MIDDTFLGKAAARLLELFGNDLSGAMVVLPNRRAGLFLRKYLSEGAAGACWAPRVYSIEDFIISLSGLQEIGQVQLLVELYEVHRELEGDQAAKFDDFLSWGPQLLADFNEADRYLVDPQELFTYLDNVRTLTVWNPSGEPPTEFQRNYLRFYRSLLPCYEALRSRLLTKGLGYQGLLFRVAAERLTGHLVSLPEGQVFFAGFNAMTAAEERIIGWMVDQGLATLFWDADQYYLQDETQEAGRFLRQWQKKWPVFSDQWVIRQLATGAREIVVTGVPDLIGQVRHAGSILKELAGQQLLNERTAVILPDEQLLIPMLNSLPEEVGEVNITMGLPLDMTPLAQLMELIFSLHLSTVRMQQLSSRPGHYYFRDVLKVLRHPYVRRLAEAIAPERLSRLPDLLLGLEKGTRIFVPAEEITGPETSDRPGFLSKIFQPWIEFQDAITGMQGVLENLVQVFGQHDRNGDETERMEVEYAFAMASLLRELQEILKVSASYLNWETFYRFFRQLLSSTTLPFYGEPLKGIQIMGMLETRNLDFDQLIILSCNEGVLPAGRGVHSFIPLDVKHEFGLPTYRHQDAVYAYHFYRLLQRAKKVWLLYNTEPDKLGGGEISRFARQIHAELIPVNPATTWEERLLAIPVPAVTLPPEILVSKHGTVWTRLLEKASTGLAPTALNHYRRCPLRFYYSEIAGLREPEEVEEEIDAQSLGQAVHAALHHLYQPFAGKSLTPEAITTMEPLIDGAVENAFAANFSAGELGYGKNLLLVEVARIMVRRFIALEKTFLFDLKQQGATMIIVMLEEPLKREIQLNHSHEPVTVLLKGFVDRVDRIAGVTRVIDYKTGRVEKKELTFSDWSGLISDPVPDKGFQLLMYAWLIAGQGGHQRINAGIFSLREQSAGLLCVTVPGEDGKTSGMLDANHMDETAQALRMLIEEIFNPGQPFTQTSDPDQCRICPFIDLCGR